jgi:AraC-like DNA-binding protein
MEVAELDPGVLLILSHCTDYPENMTRQAVEGGGWTHIQFRLSGAGSESLIAGGDHLETPQSSCIITSYAEEALIDRHCRASSVQMSACLYMRPWKVAEFFHVTPEALPKELAWLLNGATDAPCFEVSPLHPVSVSAVHDMLACSFQSHARTAFMRAKAMEVVSGLLHTLGTSEDGSVLTTLAARDLVSIKSAKDIMRARATETMSLDQLAAEVGMSRSKLAHGFKDVFGVSVQAYWRDLRLDHAKNLLKSQSLSVGQIAELCGYSEVSAFSRAFAAKFGLSPRQIKANGARADIELERVERLGDL